MSRRLQPFYRNVQLQVNSVKAMTRTVQQKSDETYLALVNNSLGKYLNPEETSILRTILGEARQALELPVHAECNLAAYHSHGDQKPYSYMGISKYCCACCYWWITNYNQKSKLQWRVSGTHKKFYPNWALPPQADLSEVEYSDMKTAFASWLQSELRSTIRETMNRSGSDSSTTSQPSMGSGGDVGVVRPQNPILDLLGKFA